MNSGLAEVIFGARDKPLLWSLVGYLVLALAVTTVAVFALGQSQSLMYAVVPALVVVVTSILHRDRLRQARAVSLGAIAALLGAFSLLTSGSPLIAGITAAIVFTVTAAMKALPEWAVESDLLSLAYFLGAILSALGDAAPGAAPSVLLVGAAGVAGGLVGELTRLLVMRTRGTSQPVAGELAGRTLSERLRIMADLELPVVRFAIVRGMTLGIGIATLEAGANRHIAWILVAVFAVMRPFAHDTLRTATMRSGATLVGVLLVGLIGTLASAQVTLLVGVAALLVGILFLLRSPVPITVGSAMVAVAAAGLPGEQFLTWAFYRFVETLIGSALALAVIFIFMPLLNRLIPTQQVHPADGQKVD